MHKTARWVVAPVIGVALALAAPRLFAQGKGGHGGNKGGSSSLSLCVTFRDGVGDRITSDGVQVYCDNVLGVQATLGLDQGGFRLDTNNQGRTVGLDFTECLAGESCSPPFGKDTQDIDLRNGEEFTFDSAIGWIPTGHQLNMADMDGGETRYGTLTVNFTTGPHSKDGYQVLFGESPYSTCSGGSQPGDPATFIRGGSSGAPLNTWTIFASDSDVSCLWQILNNFKQLNMVGHFHMPFSIQLNQEQ